MVLARFVWLQIILSMRLSFTPRSQTYISKRPFHAQPSHKLLFNKHLCHTHTRPHTCIRPQLVRRSPTASSSLILQVLKNHTWASCAQRPDKPTLIHEFKGGFMWDPQLRPLRPGASLAGTFTHLSMTVFVGRSVKDRPAAPCLSKKHKTEHPTTFFALSREGLTHTHTFFSTSGIFLHTPLPPTAL